MNTQPQNAIIGVRNVSALRSPNQTIRKENPMTSKILTQDITQAIQEIQQRHDELNKTYDDTVDGHKLLDAHIDRGLLLERIERLE